MAGLPNEKPDRSRFSVWPLGVLASGAFMIASRGSCRAASTALSSLMKPLKGPHSVRMDQVDFLKRKLSLVDWGERYVSVTGPRGVGKTCLIDTALNREVGVVRTQVCPGDTRKMIEEGIMRAVTNTTWKWADVEGSFRRVIFWHRVFTLGKSPIVVIDLKERKADEQHANIAGVVRELMQNYGLRVIVDCSTSSLDPFALRTGGCDQVGLEPLSDETIAEVAEFKQAREWLKEDGLKVAALELFGGSPLAWSDFVDAGMDCRFSSLPSDERKHAIEKYLLNFYGSRKCDADQELHGDPKARAVAKRFFENNECLPLSNDVIFESPEGDKIFRSVLRESEFYLEPATRVLFYALKYGDQIDSIDRLKDMTALEHKQRRSF